MVWRWFPVHGPEESTEIEPVADPMILQLYRRGGTLSASQEESKRRKSSTDKHRRSVVSWTTLSTSGTCLSLPTVCQTTISRGVQSTDTVSQSTTANLPLPTPSFSVPVSSHQLRPVRLDSQILVRTSKSVVSQSSPLPFPCTQSSEMQRILRISQSRPRRTSS